jgi:glycosyltransferase involved in cell wall biosynthesis
MRSGSLAILTPKIGDPSETFIRRHIEELLPGKTVVVAGLVDRVQTGHWTVDCPTFLINQAPWMSLTKQIVHTLRRKWLGRTQDSTSEVKRFLRKHRVQVILGEWLHFSLPLLEVARELGIRFFGHAHGSDVSIRIRERGVEYLRYNQADGVITMSQSCKRRLTELGLAPANIHVVPYGVEVPSDPPVRTQRNTIRCIAIGRMVAKKAPILALDAFRRASKVFPRMQLDYIGGGPLLPAAQQFVHAFGLGNQVKLYGSQPSELVQRLFSEADIFLQHSMTDPQTGDEEGLPVAILEAMAHGLPVISTRHAGIPEAVVDGVTGYLVNEGESALMAECLVTLARDLDLRRRMGDQGWLRAKEFFSWKAERAALLKIMNLQ